MVVHAALLMQHAQRYAAGLPLVVTGDFNTTPGQAAHRLIVQGRLVGGDTQAPPPPPKVGS